MSWMGEGALPLGMIFFASLVWGVLRRKSGNRRAAKLYPELGRRLGLRYRPSPYRNGVGSLVGHYQGFAVVIDPDDQRRIRLRFETGPAVDLRSYLRDSGPAHGMRTVFTRDKKFDGFFKTRWAADAERKMLESLEAPGHYIQPFHMIRELKELNVTNVGISCVFDYGSPPYIPVEVVEHILPAMAALARLFEAPQPADAAPGTPRPSKADREASTSN
jgi:hypothetical protein